MHTECDQAFRSGRAHLLAESTHMLHISWSWWNIIKHSKPHSHCSMNLMILATFLISVVFSLHQGFARSTNTLHSIQKKKRSREHNDYNSIVNCFLGLPRKSKWSMWKHFPPLLWTSDWQNSASWEKLLEWNHGLIFVNYIYRGGMCEVRMEWEWLSYSN